MKTAIIYTRVSSAEQVQGTSLETQERDLREWCQRKGYEITNHHQDAGESATTMDRPGLRAAMEEAKKFKVDAFIVHKFDRLTRKTIDGLTIRMTLATHGCELISISEPTSKDEAGEFFETMLFSAAQYENKRRAGRCKDGANATVAKGGWCWTAPKGYTLARNAAGVPILLPDAELAPVIAQALRGVLAGTISKADAIALMVKAGMSRTRAFAVFTTPVYGGLIRSQKSIGDVRAAFDGIITPEEWYALEAITTRLKKPRNARNHNNDTLPLVKILICPECGKPLVGGVMKKRYSYYWCRDKHVCFRAEKAHESLMTLLDSSILLQAKLENDLQQVIEYLTAEMEKFDKRRSKLQEQITRTEKQKTTLALAYASGNLLENEFQSAMAELRRQHEDLNLELVKLRTPDDFIEQLLYAKTTLKRLSFAYSTLPTCEKKKLLKLLFGTLTPSKDGNHVKPPKECVFTTFYGDSTDTSPSGKTHG